jgi:hypothetical protein
MRCAVSSEEREAAITRVAEAIVGLVETGTETLADDIWAACAAAAADVRRGTPGAAPVARTQANLEALARRDGRSERGDAFAAFLLF